MDFETHAAIAALEERVAKLEKKNKPAKDAGKENPGKDQEKETEVNDK